MPAYCMFGKFNTYKVMGKIEMFVMQELNVKKLNRNEMISVNGGNFWRFIAGYVAGKILDEGIEGLRQTGGRPEPPKTTTAVCDNV